MNVSIIGCGVIGQKRSKFLQKNQLVVACSLDLNKAKKISSQFDNCIATDSVDLAINHPDVNIVIVSVVNSKLAPITVLAVNKGKHVLVEKPGAISVLELDEIDQQLELL